MTELVRAGDLIGRPVVTIDGGDDIAEVKDVVYDSVARRLVGFTLNKRGWFRGSIKELLAAESVAAIGDTAVMIRDLGALQRAYGRADRAGAVLFVAQRSWRPCDH